MTTTRPRPRAGDRRGVTARALATAVAAVLCAVPACYTLIEHPGIARQNYRRPPRDARCTGCHSRAELRAYLEPARLSRERTPWDRLSHPWWFDARVAADSVAADDSRPGDDR